MNDDNTLKVTVSIGYSPGGPTVSCNTSLTVTVTLRNYER
jgi:hypothetical protein